jgi:hypothetical protein
MKEITDEKTDVTKHDLLASVTTTELDTAVEFVGDESPLDPTEALRVRYALCLKLYVLNVTPFSIKAKDRQACSASHVQYVNFRADYGYTKLIQLW